MSDRHLHQGGEGGATPSMTSDSGGRTPRASTPEHEPTERTELLSGSSKGMFFFFFYGIVDKTFIDIDKGKKRVNVAKVKYYIPSLEWIPNYSISL
jgi:hypothetical protein